MCDPVTLTIAATAMTAAGTGFSALQANQQAKYQAKIAERNAALEREAGQIEQQNMREAAMARYREMAQIKGQQRLAAGAGGVAIDFGTSADSIADTNLLGREDVSRIYQQGNQNLRGSDIQTSNFIGEANAQRQAGKGALIKGAFDMGSTILGGAQQYKKLKAA